MNRKRRKHLDSGSTTSSSIRRCLAARSSALLTVATGLVLGLSLGSVACSAPSQGDDKGYIDSDVAFEYRSATELGVLQPRWQLVRVARRVDDPTKLVHVVEVPPEDAGALMMLSDRQRARQVAEVACPKANEEIWNKLDRRHDIEVDMRSENGQFDTVSCRQQLF